MVVREVYDTHRDSTFSLLEEIITDLELDHNIRCISFPMQIRFPNGSKILVDRLRIQLQGQEEVFKHR
ncbi:hypothetical protein WQ54_15705 [Bacillus sp. SA1-12]|nr:hypothetical protein WQ54_15705 [Bacillus sp. SA1-12]